MLSVVEADPAVPLDEHRLGRIHELRCGQPFDDFVGVVAFIALDLGEDSPCQALKDLHGRVPKVIAHLELGSSVGPLPADLEVAVCRELCGCIASEVVSDLLEGLVQYLICCSHFLQLLFFRGFSEPRNEKRARGLCGRGERLIVQKSTRMNESEPQDTITPLAIRGGVNDKPR